MKKSFSSSLVIFNILHFPGNIKIRPPGKIWPIALWKKVLFTLRRNIKRLGLRAIRLTKTIFEISSNRLLRSVRASRMMRSTQVSFSRTMQCQKRSTLPRPRGTRFSTVLQLLMKLVWFQWDENTCTLLNARSLKNKLSDLEKYRMRWRRHCPMKRDQKWRNSISFFFLFIKSRWTLDSFEDGLDVRCCRLGRRGDIRT